MSEAAFNKILKELKDIKASNLESRKDFKELKASNERILKDFHEFKIAHELQVKEMKAGLSKLTEENLGLKKVCNQLITKYCNLEKELLHINQGLNRLQQEKLSNHFVIPGIPIRENECLKSLIIKIGDLLNVDLKNTEFTVIRLKTDKKPSMTLLVQSAMKQKLFERRKANVILLDQLGFKSTRKEVFFYHQLTKFNHELLVAAKTELKSTNLVKFVWFQNNQVLVRRTSQSSFISVHSKKDVLDLASAFKLEDKESSSDIIDLVSDQSV